MGNVLEALLFKGVRLPFSDTYREQRQSKPPAEGKINIIFGCACLSLVLNVVNVPNNFFVSHLNFEVWSELFSLHFYGIFCYFFVVSLCIFSLIMNKWFDNVSRCLLNVPFLYVCCFNVSSSPTVKFLFRPKKNTSLLIFFVPFVRKFIKHEYMVVGGKLNM